MSPSDFRSQFMPFAIEVQTIYGLPAAAVLAQAALETGWGQYIAKDIITGKSSNNFFNIKARSNWTGEFITKDTRECINGVWSTVSAKFRAYPSPRESFLDYGYFILHGSNGRYDDAVANVNDPEKYVEEMWKAGYATDPKYVQKILSIMRKYFS